MNAPTHPILERWNVGVVVAAGIGAAVAGFVIPPPELIEPSDQWLTLGRFLVAVLILLFTIPIRSWSAKRHARIWAGITIACVAVGVTLLLRYQGMLDQWTVPYAGARVIHGSNMQPMARAYVDSAATAGRPVTDSAMVFLAGGETDRVWDNSDRLQNSQRIALVYLGMLTVFATTLVSATQVAYCSTIKR